MNNIITANDCAFSLGLKFRVSRNRCEGCSRRLRSPRRRCPHLIMELSTIMILRLEVSPHVDVKSRAVMPENESLNTRRANKLRVQRFFCGRDDVRRLRGRSLFQIDGKGIGEIEKSIIVVISS